MTTVTQQSGTGRRKRRILSMNLSDDCTTIARMRQDLPDGTEKAGESLTGQFPCTP
jgi:hypothetical protein